MGGRSDSQNYKKERLMSTLAQAVHDRGVAGRLATMWREVPPDLRRRLVTIYALLIGFNIVIWALLLLTSARCCWGWCPWLSASGCATPSTLTTSPPSTIRRAS
jgi:hypothetical protein